MSVGTEEESPLMELQRRMARAVMQPLTRQEGMRARNDDGARMTEEAGAFIKPNDRLTSFERLEIYNRQYWFRIFGGFEEDFPGLQAIVGKKRFENLMRAYLEANPSTSFTLRNLGSKLPEWLAENLVWTEPREQLCADMVKLEWTHIECFDAAEWPALAPEKLAMVGPATKFELQPYLYLIELAYPVDDLLIAVRNESGSSDTSSNNATVFRKTKYVRKVAELAPQKIWLAVHRMENSVYYKRLEQEEFLMLQALRGGEPLEGAIEAGFGESAMDEAARGEFLQMVFRTWAMLGWFCEAPKAS